MGTAHKVGDKKKTRSRSRGRERNLEEMQRDFCLAALAVAAEGNGLSVEMAAQRSSIPLEVVLDWCADESAVVAMVVAMIDDDAAMRYTVTADDATPRLDRLFDVIMSRMDVLQLHRAGVMAIADTVRSNPRLALTIARAHLRTARVLAGALGDTSPRLEIMLFFVHEAAILCWLRDTSPDMGNTMAAVDRMLRFLVRERD